MAKEIFLPYGVSGLTTLYASIRRPSDGQRWYTVTPAWEAYNAAHVAAGYAIALAEEGTSGNYYADFPAGITAAGFYEIVVRKQAGGSPAWPADAVAGTQGSFEWAGSAINVPTSGDASGRVLLQPTQSGVTIPTVTTVGTLTTYTGNTPQTGDSFARIGAAGAGLTGITGVTLAAVTHTGAVIPTVTTVTTTTTATNLTNLPAAPTDWLSAAATSAAAVTKLQAGLATPTNITAGTMTTVTNLTNLPAVPTDWLAASGVKADAVTKIQAGLSTYAGGDTSGTTTLLSRVTGSVALATQIPASFNSSLFVSPGVFATAALANAPTGGAAPTVVQIRQEMDANSAKLANLDVATSTRSTYAGGAVASVTGNVGGNVAGSVGSVTGAVGSVTGSVGSVAGAVGSVTGSVGSVSGAVASVTAPVTLTSAYDPAKTAQVSAATGAVVAGSTGSSVTVSGLPAGRSYIGQRLYHATSGEARTIASQTFASSNYTFGFTGSSGTEAGPFSSVTAGDAVCPVP